MYVHICVYIYKKISKNYRFQFKKLLNGIYGLKNIQYNFSKCIQSEPTNLTQPKLPKHILGSTRE